MPSYSPKRKISLIFLAMVDMLLINLSIILAFSFRFSFNSLPSENIQPYLHILPYISILSLVILYMFNLYESQKRHSLYNLLYSVILSVLMIMIVTMALTFFSRGFSYPRSVIILSSLFQVVFLASFRSVLLYMHKYIYGGKTVLVITDNNFTGDNIVSKLNLEGKGWFKLNRILKQHEIENVKLEDIISNVDVILVDDNINYHNKSKVVNISTQFGKEMLIVPKLYELALINASAEQVGDMLVFSIQPPKLSNSQLLIKRIFDIVVSLAILIVTSPIFLIMYILIPLNSPGPVLFKQERIGKDFKPYIIYKFRSMINNAEKETGPILSTDNDSRITSIGKLIRATRIDELPQLINVLNGDMSLIGPRPERQYFIAQFIDEIPNYSYRMAVKPGITGLAQVLAKYDTSAIDKLRYDIMYVKNYSLLLDLKILFQTIRVVLQKENARGVKPIQKGVLTLKR